MDEVARRLELEIEHHILPWERAQYMVRNGDADAFIATPTPQRAEYALPSHEVVAQWDIALYFRRGDTRFGKIENLCQLSQFRIGSMLGNSWVRNNLAGMHVLYASKMEQLPRLLLADRIDVVPDSPHVMRELLNTPELQAKIDATTLAFLSRPMYLYMGKKSPQLERLGQIDAALRQMRSDGALARIQQRYKLAD